MVKFEELRVYQQTLDYVDLVYSLTKLWPIDETYGLISQIRRASVSICLNIAEGSSRSTKDFRHFLDLSRGSCYERIAIIEIARRQNILSQSQYIELYEELINLSKMISALKLSLR